MIITFDDVLAVLTYVTMGSSALAVVYSIYRIGVITGEERGVDRTMKVINKLVVAEEKLAKLRKKLRLARDKTSR